MEPGRGRDPRGRRLPAAAGEAGAPPTQESRTHGDNGRGHGRASRGRRGVGIEHAPPIIAEDADPVGAGDCDGRDLAGWRTSLLRFPVIGMFDGAPCRWGFSEVGGESHVLERSGRRARRRQRGRTSARRSGLVDTARAGRQADWNACRGAHRARESSCCCPSALGCFTSGAYTWNAANPSPLRPTRTALFRRQADCCVRRYPRSAWKPTARSAVSDT